MTKKREKTTRPFSLILDDIVRSPSISSNEFRLYSILLSYCAKTAAVPTCEVSKTLLAAHMGLTVRGVTNIIRRLESETLLTISYAENEQKPVYTMNVAPPSTICPDQFKGRQIQSAISYIRESGGVRAFQKQTRSLKPKKSKRTGWPKTT